MSSLIRNILILIVVLILPRSASAVLCYTTTSGNWNNPAIWSCGHMPAPGDSAIIQVGHTVTQSNNQTYSGAPIHIDVYGTWNFAGGGSKITLPCGSYIEIHPGGVLNPDPTYNGFSETVRICNVTYWNTTMGPQQGYIIWPPPPTPLPVELISFNAINEDVSVRLRWTTASERNISQFNIYRSQETVGRKLIGSQAAAGESNSVQQYEMKDLPPATGQYYYHLDEVKPDGTQQEIAISAVNFFKNEERLRCVPNPLDRNEALSVDVPFHSKGLDVLIVGTEGRWMRPSSVDMDGSLIVVMDGLNLASGIYTLQVVESGGVLGTCRFKLD